MLGKGIQAGTVQFIFVMCTSVFVQGYAFVQCSVTLCKISTVFEPTVVFCVLFAFCVLQCVFNIVCLLFCVLHCVFYIVCLILCVYYFVFCILCFALCV